MLIYTGVTTIDITGVETLLEIRRSLEAHEIKVIDGFYIIKFKNKSNFFWVNCNYLLFYTDCHSKSETGGHGEVDSHEFHRQNWERTRIPFYSRCNRGVQIFAYAIEGLW